MITEQLLKTILRLHRRNYCSAGIDIKLLPYEKWYKIIRLPKCSCFSTQNGQRWSQQILMQLNSIKADM
jgi:hypothetical protein